MSVLLMILKLVAALLVILPLIYISIKYGGNRLQNMQNGNYMKILERLTLTKENSLLIIKIGEKAYVFSSSGSKLEILMELEPEELKKIQESKKVTQYKDFNEFYRNFKGKLNIHSKNELLKKLKDKFRVKDK
ncbi:flagellar biosynthesis protein FliZ [Clostridium pasteurianum DSM 525 = ATCC 6013]|uniref:Flagellar biosynthesis protein FliZ n=1 Tax=Clostridium pasteurianum DSM 525 = ATCC 6013 TaxID=1262449 RepID=A0A0H3J1W5_CLOPA|nr:flagellar biosynthetic protein FliO [Clostridium pasteurianum]AJA47896.1 flagellar biosynthesis protein FliZ [Clostridium pasteurianum DSM 525 = ATCC 6013]AJA51884.1 flagellar biosynthesis protein FliZ [Clostridium pasteurianum DSM 525 = ATCC 6013]AOZ75186.1 flagellar biosynthesis protein FliZ [Clostridium pasteurianum DSM 525 = ATCC 6013]AOZ78981.1 flagellar biosynthesis protein FliZ [Clostridium pasteurianum]ELP59799.1 Flagellar biosynthesis protein FliZ [Clostridium pasteurianum DSM 525 